MTMLPIDDGEPPGRLNASRAWAGLAVFVAAWFVGP